MSMSRLSRMANHAGPVRGMIQESIQTKTLNCCFGWKLIALMHESGWTCRWKLFGMWATGKSKSSCRSAELGAFTSAYNWHSSLLLLAANYFACLKPQRRWDMFAPRGWQIHETLTNWMWDFRMNVIATWLWRCNKFQVRPSRSVESAWLNMAQHTAKSLQSQQGKDASGIAAKKSRLSISECSIWSMHISMHMGYLKSHTGLFWRWFARRGQFACIKSPRCLMC